VHDYNIKPREARLHTASKGKSTGLPLGQHSIQSVAILVRKYNNYRMNQYLDKEIDKRFVELASSRGSSAETSRSKSRSIIALAMDKYLNDVEDKNKVSKSAFKQLANSQLRMFLYAGHDITSSTFAVQLPTAVPSPSRIVQSPCRTRRGIWVRFLA
jgi:hypothetical protein